MTTVYALGTPRTAAQRGGDVRARDMTRARNVYGPHRFAATDDLRLSNGMIRVTVGPSGAVPTLTVEVYTGGFTVDDFLSNTLSDTLEGTFSPSAWAAMGTVTIDSTAVTAVLTGARLVRVSPESATVRLVSSALRDIFITLRRGERMIRIQHGSTRPPTIFTARRVRWTGVAGTTSSGRVVETTPALAGFPRTLLSLHNVTASGTSPMSLTTPSFRTAYFGAGVATSNSYESASDLHRQLSRVSRTQLLAELVS